MADIQSNIQVGIDTTQALASIKNLQRQISAFHSSMAKGGAAANAVSAQLQQTLINSISSTGKFAAEIRTIKTTTESFTTSLERNKFSLGEYFRYAGGASKTFGRLFKTEFDTINKVARENVKDLQTQYIRLGRDASGAMKAIAVRPLSLDMTDLGTRTQVAAQKQALLNQLLKQGSTNLLNFGKNTQWAGRQLMVGFTLPLIALGSAASKTFMDMETQAIRFKKVYGDLFTPQAESQQALKDIQDLGKEFTKYGIAVSSTVGLAAEAAAAGFKGVDLQRQTAAATKLSILGQVESQKALETTISLQNAFSMSSENLAESIDFLNAVENQTVLSLDDISTAIPKAAPIVQQLGGDVKDLAFLMTAMKEGGINASEGANALKSGLASLINPTGKANDMLLSFGINAKKIVVDNKGDLKKTVVEFATALNQLDPLNRAQAIEQMFGKFQFSRLSTLFANVTKEGTQASRVLDLAGSSVQELAALSEKELGMTSESAMNKFRGSIENLKLSLIPLGEEFLKAVTPIAEFITRILEKFDGLSANTKKIIVTITAVVAGLGPVFLMTFGLLANGLANIIKGFTFLKTLFNKTGQSTATLGTEVRYMTTEQRNAAAVAASLDQVHVKLAQTFTSEASAVNALTQAYQRAIAAQSQFVPVAPPITRGPIRKFAGGRPATVGGTGNKDSELALLMPGETVIPTAMSAKYGGIINAMIADKVPGYEDGKTKGLYGGQERLLAPYTMFAPGNTPGGFGMDRAFLSSPDFAKSMTNTMVASGAIEGGFSLTQKTMDELLRQASPYADEITDQLRIAAQELTDAGTDATHISQLFEKKKKEIDQILSRMTASSPQGAAMARGTQVFAYPTDKDIISGGNARVPGVDVDENGNIVRAAPRSDRTGKAKSFQDRIKKVLKRNPLSSDKRLTRAHVVPEERVVVGDIRPLGGRVLELPADKQAAARAELEKRHIKLSKELGIRDIKAYDSGVKSVKVQDPYEASTALSRKSPHPEAAQDGKDDARAYATARDKELRKQSGKARRVARRAQGPAPIGATPLPGATILPIVPPNPKTPPEPTLTTRQKLAGKMTGMGGGMGLLGVNMGLSMAPDFAGKGMAQAGLAGANLGMMFGPQGMAAGAAIGLITSAFTTLIAKQKEHAAITRSTFTVSTDLITLLGDKVLDTSLKITGLSSDATEFVNKFGMLSPEIQALVDAISKLPEDNPLAIFVKQISEADRSLSSITGSVRSQVTTAISMGGLDPENAEKYVLALLTAAGKAHNFGEVWKSVSKDVIDVSTATTTSFNKLNDAVGSAPWDIFVNGVARGTVAYKDLSTSQQILADQMKNMLGLVTNGSLTFDEINTRIQALDKSSISSKTAIAALSAAIYENGSPAAIERLNGLNKVIRDAGKEGKISTGEFYKMQIALEMLARQGKNLGDVGVRLFGAGAQSVSNAFVNLAAASQDSYLKEFFDNLAAAEKERNKVINDYVDTEDGVDGLSKASEAYLKVLDAEIKGLEAKRDAQKNVNDESQRQIDLQMKMKGLANEAVLAKISGDYIRAASLQQQAQNVQFEFNQETELRKKDAEIARLKAREAEIKGGAPTTKAEAAKIPKDPKAKKNASGGMIRGAGTATSDSIPAYLSNGEYVIKADSVKKYGVGTFDQLNAGRFANGGLIPGYKDGGQPKKWYEGFQALTKKENWGVGKGNGVVDLPYNIGYKGIYKGLLFPAALMLDRATRLGPGQYGSPLSSTNKKREAELLAKSRAEGFGSIAGESLLTAGLDMASVIPLTGVGSKIANFGFSKTQIAEMASEKAAAKLATRTAKEEAGIGLPGMLQSIKSKLTPNSTNSVLRKKFEAMKKEGKLSTPEGSASRIELAISDALIAARKNNFTPLMDLRSTTSQKLIAENEAMPSLIEEAFTLNGKNFVFRFTKAPLTKWDAPVIDDFLTSIKNPKTGLGREMTVPAAHLAEIIDPLNGQQAASITFDAITGAIRYRQTASGYKEQGLSAFLYNKAGGVSRIRHSQSLTDPGRASAPRIGGFMADDPIFDLPGMSSLPGLSTLKTTVQKIIKKPKKTKKPKKSIAPTPARPGTPESNYEVFLSQRAGSGSSPSSFGGGFRHANPNPREPYIDPFEEQARRRAAADQAISAEGLDAARISWRENPNRTHDTYPFVNGSLYDYEDNFELMQLMQQGVSKPARVPWRSNNQAPAPTIFAGKETSVATGGFIDKGKVRVPKFAMGGLIKGPGTGISDSISATLGYAGGGSIRVSNGEYVVKASSVRDYGVKTMDAINNGTATVGTNSGGTVYNINMPVTSNNANAEIVANEVVRKLKLEVSKNNKSNKVGL